MGGFTKGMGGRPKGAKNVMTREIKDAVQFIVDYMSEPDRLREMLDRLSKEKPEVLVNFLAKVYPRDTPMTGNRSVVILRLPPREIEPTVITTEPVET